MKDRNPLHTLRELGQSVWYDNVDRAQLDSGQFARLLTEDRVTGATANPTTFQKALAAGNAYDKEMGQLLAAGVRDSQLYEALATADVRRAADLLRPVYDRTEGEDGYVSLEVSPELARDTAGTMQEARRLHRLVDKPNLMVKIPATAAGIPAIRMALAEGINVNITLIFSIENYREVAEAYLDALTDRRGEGRDLRVASVASFFVSRVDVLVDKLLEERIAKARTDDERAHLNSLLGKAAIANARLVYQEFRRIFEGPRFEELRQKGARPQRPLWASTGAKNPAYRDVLYAEELIGPSTVDTMPLETLEAFRDHGRPRLSLEEDLQGAQRTMDALAGVGIRYEEVTRQLQEEGVRKFADSFKALLEDIRKRRGG
jgi:transaldolase